MNSDKLICTSIDDNYLWPWMVMVHSAVQNSESEDFEFIVANVNKSLSQKYLDIVDQFVKSLGFKVSFVDITTSLNPSFNHQFNITVYARLFLMDILEQDFVWFDADLILLPGWDQIFSIDIGDASNNTVLTGVLDSKISRQNFAENNNGAYVKTGGAYVNAGVLKVSVKNWQLLDKSANWKDLALNLHEYGLSHNDQDVINYLCADKISLLPQGFNYIVGDQISIKERIYVKHYAGYPKPWKLDIASKEFLLAVQGVNYFKPKYGLTQSSDAFLHYPMYWQFEEELTRYLQGLDWDLHLEVEQSRQATIKRLDWISRVKHFLLQFISRRFFN